MISQYNINIQVGTWPNDQGGNTAKNHIGQEMEKIRNSDALILSLKPWTFPNHYGTWAPVF